MKNPLTVYSIIEPLDSENKAYWQRLGIAFRNKDGSLNVKLNGLPTNGTLHIREDEDRSREEKERG